MNCHYAWDPWLSQTSLRATRKTLPSFLPLLKNFHFFPPFPIPPVSNLSCITHFVRFDTYPPNPFKVIPIFLKVYQVPIEGPGEHNVQGVVVGHLARQDDAFPNCDIHAERRNHDPGWIYKQQRKKEKTRIILVLLRSRDIVGLREILSSDHLGRSLNQQVNYSIFGFMFSLVFGLKLY